MRPVSLSESGFDKHGLMHDRRLMIVRPNPKKFGDDDYGDEDAAAPTHRFVTQRQSPKLATIEATEPIDIVPDDGEYNEVDVVDDERRRRRRRRRSGGTKVLIKLTSSSSSSTLPGSAHVYVDVSPSRLNLLPVRYRAGLWGDVVDVVDVGDEAASFVSGVMCMDDPGYRDVRVVSLLPGTTSRKVDEKYCPDAARVGCFGSLPHGGLTDGFPVSFVVRSFCLSCRPSPDHLIFFHW
jgi:hypothetical protein